MLYSMSSEVRFSWLKDKKNLQEVKVEGELSQQHDKGTKYEKKQSIWGSTGVAGGQRVRGKW